jgi:predicted GNAT family acetyltransferase
VAKQRFELVEEGLTAFADYYDRGEALVIPHVESPPPLRGRGTAARLMQGLAETAREEGIKLIPTCSYAAAWFRRHPDFKDVLA